MTTARLACLAVLLAACGDDPLYITGPAATGFTTKGADANLQVTFNFASYE